LPEVQNHFHAGQFDAAFDKAKQAATLGTLFEDRDLVALARHFQGRARLAQGRVHEGLALLDETMIAVTGGELSPRATGMIYCSVVEACQEVFALDRAREWTSSLARWCNEQESLVTFTGTCLVHRAQVLQMAGEWEGAENEVKRARERLGRLRPPRSQGWPLYELAEIHRLRGALDTAEQTFEEAAKQGYDPQPGLALLRVAQGRAAPALASVKRALTSTSEPRQRARLLPAAVEICVAAGDIDTARAHGEELQTIATTFGTPALAALADDACAAVLIATGNAEEALPRLQRAADVWQTIPAPYAHARTRSNIARACRLLGDTDGCSLAFEAARAALKALGAEAALTALDAAEATSTRERPAGLTPRELEVLRLVATGKSSKAIAQELYLSVKTVDRHLSNIFTKLGVASRAEATARAYQLNLL
jgi:ATP/maltotriose-dependent transcriptional regulator MalT